MNIPIRFNLPPSLAGAGFSLLFNPQYIADHGVVRGMVLHAFVAGVCHAVSNASMRVLGTGMGLMAAGLLGLGGGYWAGQYGARHYVVPYASQAERAVRHFIAETPPFRRTVSVQPVRRDSSLR